MIPAAFSRTTISTSLPDARYAVPDIELRRLTGKSGVDLFIALAGGVDRA